MLFSLIVSALSATSIILSSSDSPQGLISQVGIPKHHAKFFGRKLFHEKNIHNPLYLNPEAGISVSPSNKCKPQSFGMTVQNFRIYSNQLHDCKSRQKNIQTFNLSIDENSRKLLISCPISQKPVVFTGPYSRKFAKEGFRGHLLNEDEENYSQIEYLLGFCTDINKTEESSSSIMSFDEIDEKKLKADMSPVFNESLFNETRSVSKSKVVIMINFDYLSRSHFYREFPETIKFLNESQFFYNFSVFDFKLFSIYHSSSFANKQAVLNGVENFQDNYEEVSNEKHLEGKSFWKIMKEKKFVNFIGFDYCDRNFGASTDDESFIDYSVQEFYCILENQRFLRKDCIGQQESFEYLLKYSSDLLKFYTQNNLFINLNLGGPEDQAGKFSAKYDKSLMKFIKETFQERFSDQIIFFIQGDLGIKLEEFPKTLEEFQEFKLPALFLLAGKEILENERNSFDHLNENSNRLVSKLDIRKTILRFVGVHDESTERIDLMREVSSNLRDCSDVSLSTVNCPCSDLLEVDSANLTISKILKKVMKVVEDFLNKELSKKENFCDKVLLNIFGKVFRTPDDGFETFLIELRSSSHSRAIFQVTTAIGKKIVKRSRRWSLTQFNIDLFGNSFKGIVIDRQVYDIHRVDQYLGWCQVIAREKGINPQYCLKDKC